MYDCNCNNNIGAGNIKSTDNDQYLRIEWCDNITDVPTKGTFLDKIQGLIDSESDVSTRLDTEIERAKTAEQNIQSDLNNEILERRSDDDKLQSQINVLVEKQAQQQEKIITRTLSDNTVTETFDAPNGEQILILQDENKTGKVIFDKTTDTVTLTGTNVKIHNIVTPVADTDVTNKVYVDNIKQDLSTELSNVTEKITQEISNRKSADEQLQQQITTNADAIVQNEENIVNETTERKTEDANLQKQITENREDIKSNKDNIDAEIDARNNEDEKLQEQITANKTSIESEITNRTTADTALQTQITANKNDLTQEISDRQSADENLQQQISNITAVQIRNKSEVIESTEAEVQTTATNYIKTNYDRDPQNFDGLIITVTDKNNDKILYIYSEVSKIWINSGINDVDLSNYYQKSEIDTKIDTINQSITNEIEARTTADTTLQTNIDNEVKRAKEAEAANESLINKEITERKTAINELAGDVTSLGSGVNAISNDLNTEVERATAKEASLESAINGKQDKFATYTVTESNGVLVPDADTLSIEGKTITLTGNGEGIHSQITVSANSAQVNGKSVSISSTDGTNITNVVIPTEDTDAANKKYVDDNITALSDTYATKTELNNINNQIKSFDIYSDSTTFETINVLIPKENS